ncbi:MAG: transposase [Candidatus Omnitrophota bacterium]
MVKLVEGEVYHVFSKSIAGFVIFNNDQEFLRFIDTIKYYRVKNPPLKFSIFLRQLKSKNRNKFKANKEKLVEIVSYCLMPTHFHLVLKQLSEKGTSTFISNLLNSYTRYFNTKHNRKGPLWEGRFKKVLVENDEQLLHLTRYTHLNPTTAYLVDSPKDWQFSSYREYLSVIEEKNKICEYREFFDINPATYREFVEDSVAYQREAAGIKQLVLE